MKYNKYIFLGGLGLVLVSIVMELMGKEVWSWMTWLVLASGLAVGFFNVDKKESPYVLIGYVVVTSGLLAMAFLPKFGENINIIAKWLSLMITPLAVFVGGKVLYNTLKN